MNIILLGYMGSGKSLIGHKLSKILSKSFVDFDAFIELKEGQSIQNIFKSNGEIYFRKMESKYLIELLETNKNSIIALGGGTPCYGNNMQIIKSDLNTRSVFLKVSVIELSNRLFQDKGKRPLLDHINSIQEMQEFIGKHLFERINFYNQTDIIINANDNPEEILEQIILKLF